MMEPPSREGLVRGEIADYYLDDSGILYAFSKPLRRTVDLIAANAELVRRISGGKPVPLLIYLSRSPVPDQATRAFSRKMLPEIYTAMAMVSEPGLSQLIMKVLFRFSRPAIPMRSFSDDEAARAWLLSYVPDT